MTQRIMPIKICLTENCENLVEGNTQFCAHHNREHRRVAKQRVLDAEKRQAKKVWYPNKSPINKVSEKRKVLNAEYSVLREEFLKEHTECELKLQGCQRVATQVHHTASGWNKATNLNNVKTWKASCDHCNQFLHDKLSASEARSKGLKI